MIFVFQSLILLALVSACFSKRIRDLREMRFQMQEFIAAYNLKHKLTAEKTHKNERRLDGVSMQSQRTLVRLNALERRVDLMIGEKFRDTDT